MEGAEDVPVQAAAAAPAEEPPASEPASATAFSANLTSLKLSVADVDIPLPVAVALAVVLISILVALWLSRRSRSSAKSILLMGPVNSGKTTLFLQLKEGGIKNGTVTSMEENDSTFIPEKKNGINKPARFVDLPGHPRLTNKFEQYMRETVGIIYVLDASDFLSKATDIADQLWAIMNHPQFSARRIPLFIACNKYDLGTKAHTDSFIEKRLHREIENTRSTNSTLEGEAAAIIGKGNEPFTFQQLKSKVAIGKISALKGGTWVDPVYDFIRNCIK